MADFIDRMRTYLIVAILCTVRSRPLSAPTSASPLAAWQFPFPTPGLSHSRKELKRSPAANHAPFGTGLGGGQRGAFNEPQLRGQRTGNGLYTTSP